MANYEYSSYSSSGGAGGGAGGALFQQADANQDGSIDRSEFSNFVSGGAGQVGVGVGGASGGYESASYESSSFSSAGGAAGVDVGLDAAALGGAGYQSSSFESSSGGVDLAAVNQAASYTSESNAAWSRYGAEVRGAGLYVDSNPQIIRRQAPGGVQTYTQNIRVRFLQPPPVPPPGPLIIKEVRPPQPPAPPPLRVRQQAPPLPQPPPLILRERPPQPPAVVASQTVIRRLAAIPVPPRSVIIERIPAAPPRPRDIIIERWVPYGAQAKRRTIVQRAEAARAYAAPRNIIIQYEQAQVRIIRQFQRLGVTLENPQAYVARYGASLLDASTLVQQARAAGVVEDISPPAPVGGAGFSSSSFSQESSFGVGGGLAGAEVVGFGGAELGGGASYSSSSFESAGGAGGVGLEAAGGFGSSSYESSFSSSSGGAAGGVDIAAAAFNSADANKDGRLDSQEFGTFVQGGL
jgi:hypothetical protein